MDKIDSIDEDVNPTPHPSNLIYEKSGTNLKSTQEWEDMKCMDITDKDHSNPISHLSAQIRMKECNSNNERKRENEDMNRIEANVKEDNNSTHQASSHTYKKSNSNNERTREREDGSCIYSQRTTQNS